MKKCRKCGETKERTEFSKNKSRKDGFESQCKSCKRAYYQKNKVRARELRKQRYLQNKEHEREIQRQYRLRNREKIRAQKKKHYSDNKEAILSRSRLWALNNKEVISKILSKWKRNNKGKVNADTAKRRAAKLQRTPSWLTSEDFKKIEEFYVEARRLTAETGIPHEVDHIYPLQGETCSGLHVPSNLQILTKAENCKKGNKLWDLA